MGLMFGGFGASASASTALPSIVWCQKCNSTQYSAAALTQPIGTTVYVGDAINRVVNAYYISVEVDDSRTPPTRSKSADTVSPDPKLVALINGAISFYNTAPTGWNKHFAVYTDNPTANSVYIPVDINVYNIADAGPQQNGLNDWLNSASLPTFGILSFASTLAGFGASFHVIDASALPQVSETIYFKDGSRVDGTIDKTSQKWRLDPSTAQDSHGNNIPYLDADGKLHGLGGQHDFDPGRGNPSDQSNFLYRLHQLGVTILLDPGAGNSGTQHGWICTYEEDTHTYTCWLS